MLEISVIIATHNRAELIAGALRSLAEQTLDRSLFEVIVVDNASTDETPAAVARFQVEHPELTTRLISEPRLGPGLARNTGSERAKGYLLAFLDDDARAEPDWLERAIGCFEEISPTPLALGGRIEPFYLAPKPTWFKDSYEIRSWGDKPRFLNAGEAFSGSNMIVVKSVLSDHGGFSEHLGPKGERFSVGEETVLYDEIWHRNPRAPLYYSPDLVVRHAVPAQKMTVSYCLKRALIEGQVWYDVHSAGSTLGRVRYIVFEAAPGLFRSLAASPFHLRRYEHYQNWLFEDFSIVASRLGGLLASLGIELKMARSR